MDPHPSPDTPMHVYDLDDTLFTDERGWALNPFRVQHGPLPPLPDAHVVSLEPGAVRGNHRHPGVREWMVLFGGQVTVAGRKGGGPVEVVRVDGGRPTMVVFGPGEAHAVRGEGPGTAFLVAFNDRPEPETERVEPLLDAAPAPESTHVAGGSAADGP